MELLYTMKTKYTYDEFKKYTRAILPTKRFIAVFAAMLVLLGLASYITGSLFYVIFALIYPFVMFFLQSRQIKRTYNSNKIIQDLEVSFDFYDTYFIEKTEHGETKVEYEMLHKTVETKTNFYLMTAKNQGYIMPKSQMPEGLAEFLGKLKRK